MTETIHTFPNEKHYTGEIFKIGKEELKKIISPIKSMSNTEVAENLVKYENIYPGKDGENTFEMMALYQRAINSINKNNELRVDGHFGKDIYNALKDIQTRFGIVSNGFPGPETTKALMGYLKGEKFPQKQGAPAKGKKEAIQKMEFPEEQKIADEAIIETKKGVKIKDSFYSRGEICEIDYALIKQEDGESYLWSKPTNNMERNSTERKVFRLDAHDRVIGFVCIDIYDTIMEKGGQNMNKISYKVPTPLPYNC